MRPSPLPFFAPWRETISRRDAGGAKKKVAAQRRRDMLAGTRAKRIRYRQFEIELTKESGG
jgi:hypothetical protein